MTPVVVPRFFSTAVTDGLFFLFNFSGQHPFVRKAAYITMVTLPPPPPFTTCLKLLSRHSSQSKASKMDLTVIVHHNFSLNGGRYTSQFDMSPITFGPLVVTGVGAVYFRCVSTIKNHENGCTFTVTVATLCSSRSNRDSTKLFGHSCEAQFCGR